MTIFVAGIHGVGKSYLAQPAALRLGMRYATASQLIREELGRASWDANKRVGNVAQNQVALVSAIRRINEEGQSLLLDGHFVLRIAVDEHERLPEAVFRDVRCKAVVLLTCPTGLVLSRLLERRDNSWSEAEVISFACAEAEHARSICASLAIPLVSLQTPSSNEFDAALTGLSMAN